MKYHGCESYIFIAFEINVLYRMYVYCIDVCVCMYVCIYTYTPYIQEIYALEVCMSTSGVVIHYIE